MRKSAFVVFDDVVAGTTPAAGSFTVYTDVRYNDIMGQWDRLAVEGVADQVTAWTAYNVALENSNDGRNWVAKTTLYSRASMAANNQYIDSGNDPGTTPLLGLCRLAINVTAPVSTAGSMHLKLMVCQRDDA